MSRVFGVGSLLLGLVALVGRLGFEAARADAGSDLSINAPWIRVVLHFGSLLVALMGLANAFAAAVASPTWKSRVGLPMPGVLVNGTAIVWTVFWT